MKFLIHTIILLVVANFTTTGFILAQNASEKNPQRADREAIETAQIPPEVTGKQDSETVANTIAIAQKNVEAAAKEAQQQAEAAQKQVKAVLKQAQAVQQQANATAQLGDVLVKLGSSSTRGLSRNGGDRILVIPADQMKPEDLITIMEDMSIMSRIFDKKLSQVVPPAVPSLGEIPLIGNLFSRGGRATEGIYLQGFGAMFFMGVNFPLSPPPKVKEKETEQDVDPVWSQTRREMYTQEQGRRIIDIGTIHNGETIFLGGMSIEYDAEKVEEFKRTLTKTLKHTANIRSLKPDEWVTVTVTGANQHVVIEQEVEQPEGSGEDYRSFNITPGVNKTHPSSTVLTMRAKKSDIDAYSKGEQNFDKFSEQVQIFVY